MLPFRELEVFDAFMLDDRKCEKVALEKYLIYDETYEVESLEVADPNMMVELIEDEDRREEDQFFLSLLELIEGLERAGEKMTIKRLKKFAEDSLDMKDP